MARELAHPRGPRSLSTHLKTRLSLSGAKAGLLWELVPKDVQAQPERFAALIKALPIRVTAPRPVAEAISTAGGVRFEALDEGLMLQGAARRLLRRRDARLGSAHRRLPAHRLLRHRPRRRAGRAALAAPRVQWHTPRPS